MEFSDCVNCEQSRLLWWKTEPEHFIGKNVRSLTIKQHRIYLEMLNMLGQDFDCWNPGALRIGQKYFNKCLCTKHRGTKIRAFAVFKQAELFFLWRELGDVIFYSPYFERVTEKIAEDRIKRRKDPAGSKPENAGDLLARCKLLAPGLR